MYQLADVETDTDTEFSSGSPRTQQHKHCCKPFPGTCLLCSLLAIVIFLEFQYHFIVHRVIEMSVPPVCQLTEKSRINDNGVPFGSLTHQWRSDECQHHFQCLEPLLILDHTCVYEDTQNNRILSHTSMVLVSDKYTAIFLVNPSSIEPFVSNIMKKYLGARQISSYEITQKMIDTYFFFTYVQNSYDRFFTVAAQKLHNVLNNDSTIACQTAVSEMKRFVYAFNAKTDVLHTQAYLISADAGKSNKMVNMDWIDNTERLKGSIVDLMIKIQERVGGCLPEIDFRELNYVTIQNLTRDMYKTSMRLRGCSTGELDKAIEHTYGQDGVCFF